MRISPWSVTGLVSKSLKGQKGLSGETSMGYTPSLSRVFQSTSYGASGTPGVGQPTPQHGSAYDPTRQYPDTVPEYQAPDAWFDGASAETPQSLLSPLNGLVTHPELDEPEDVPIHLMPQGGVLTMDMVREVWAKVLQRAYGVDLAQVDSQALYEASLMSQEIVADAMNQAATADMAQFLYDHPEAADDLVDTADPLEDGDPAELGDAFPGAAEYGAGDLDQIVEGEFDEPMGGPLEMIVDDAMAEPDMMPDEMQDEQMTPMMDPFMMPGPFGPGPAL